MIVSFTNFELVPRYDGVYFNSLRIYESATENGVYNLIDTQAISPVAAEPNDPEPISFTTRLATLGAGGWYRVDFVDTNSQVQQNDPIYYRPLLEILASLDDINAHLDGSVIGADSNNTELVQISVARVIRGYLARIVNQVTLMSWSTPELTPDIIREIAGMLIASQLYFNEASRSVTSIDDNNLAQRLYDRAMLMLQGIVDGSIVLPIVPAPVTTGTMTIDDFFPIDETGRAFTVGMEL